MTSLPEPPGLDALRHERQCVIEAAANGNGTILLASLDAYGDAREALGRALGRAEGAAEREALLADLIPDLAALMAGLAVPLSLGGGTVLGAARDPYVRLRGKFNLFGYPGAEEVSTAIRVALAARALATEGETK